MCIGLRLQFALKNIYNNVEQVKISVSSYLYCTRDYEIDINLTFNKVNVCVFNCPLCSEELI